MTKKGKKIEIPKEVDEIIPVEERIDTFEQLWSMIYDEVVSYWDQDGDT